MFADKACSVNRMSRFSFTRVRYGVAGQQELNARYLDPCGRLQIDFLTRSIASRSIGAGGIGSAKDTAFWTMLWSTLVKPTASLRHVESSLIWNSCKKVTLKAQAMGIVCEEPDVAGSAASPNIRYHTDIVYQWHVVPLVVFVAATKSTAHADVIVVTNSCRCCVCKIAKATERSLTQNICT
jgi:hypothetical protein